MNILKPFLTGGLLTASACGTAFAADLARPNILLIIADDMRLDQMSIEGHPYLQTPNLDRLAKEGVRFTNAYVTSPLCGPSRASIYTARQPSAHKRYQNFRPVQELKPYLPATFHDAGYRTAMIGKFYEHNTEKESRKAYDRWFNVDGPAWPGGKEPADEEEKKRIYNERLYYDQMYTVDGEPKQIPGYQTDVLFDEASRFVSEDTARPFFIALNPQAPHKPWNPSPKRNGKYKGRGLPPNPNISLDHMNARMKGEILESYEQGAAMMEDVDEAFARLYDVLKKNGQLDNTIIVFTSDNGMQVGEHGASWKRQAWQESVRVPLLLRYPKAVKAGTTIDSLVSLADILPTMAEMTDVALPPDDLRYGKSFAGLLRGNREGAREDVLIEQYFQPRKPDPNVVDHLEWATVIRWPYKLTRFVPDPATNGPSGSLFDLAADPREDHDLYAEPALADTRAKLDRRLKKLLEENRAEASWIAP